MTRTPKLPALVAAALLLLPTPLLANHGPGASGGGTNTLSGETLKQGKFELSLREDFTQFEHFNDASAAARAEQSGDFDALRRGFITNLDAAAGLTDDLQFGLNIGYFNGFDFIGASSDNGAPADVGTVNPQGLTDMALTFKYRLLEGAPGNLALIAGATLPTGRSDVRLSNGELLSPTDQPGTGRYGMPMGLGYSRFLTPKITIDASALYTTRFEKDFFKVGNRIDLGIALAYRITDSIQTFPQLSVFAELNNVYLYRDYNQGELDPNSGSSTLYLSPGFRVRFSQQTAFTIAPSIPLYQHVNGDQGRVEFKISAAFSYSF